METQEQKDGLIIEVKTDYSGMSKVPLRSRQHHLLAGAKMGIQFMKLALKRGGSVIAIFDRGGKFEVLETVEDFNRVTAPSKEYKADDNGQ